MADDGSGPADILGAVKFNGSLGQTQYGAFLADERGAGGRRFAALRLQRAFGTHQLGAMLTSVDRPFLDRTAHVLGIDHRWQPDASLSVASTLVGSDVAVHGQHRRGIGFTSLLQKTWEQGWSLTGMVLHYDRDFQVNDAGYLGRNDLDYVQLEVDKRITALAASSVYAAHTLSARIETAWNGDRLRLQRRLQLRGESQRKDGGNVHWSLQLGGSGFDDEITRGNGAVRTRSEIDGDFEREFPRRGRWQFRVGAGFGVGGGVGQGVPVAWNAGGGATFFLSDALNIELELGYVRDQAMLIWQGDSLGPGYDNVVAGFRMQRFDLEANLNWSISPRQELRVKLEALGFDASRPQPWRVLAGGHVQASSDPVQPFSLRNLGFQVRYRYELAPLSNLYVVYARGGFASDAYATGVFDQFERAFDLRNDEQLVVKLAYRFTL